MGLEGDIFEARYGVRTQRFDQAIYGAVSLPVCFQPLHLDVIHCENVVSPCLWDFGVLRGLVWHRCVVDLARPPSTLPKVQLSRADTGDSLMYVYS